MIPNYSRSLGRLCASLLVAPPLSAQELHCSDQPAEFAGVAVGFSKIVALDGSNLWVGMPLPGSGLNAIHVLEQDPVTRTWDAVQVLPHTFPVPSNQGRNFALQGDTAIVGNAWLGPGGRVRIYERKPHQWRLGTGRSDRSSESARRKLW